MSFSDDLGKFWNTIKNGKKKYTEEDDKKFQSYQSQFLSMGDKVDEKLAALFEKVSNKWTDIKNKGGDKKPEKVEKKPEKGDEDEDEFRTVLSPLRGAQVGLLQRSKSVAPKRITTLQDLDEKPQTQIKRSLSVGKQLGGVETDDIRQARLNALGKKIEEQKKAEKKEAQLKRVGDKVRQKVAQRMERKQVVKDVIDDIFAEVKKAEDDKALKQAAIKQRAKQAFKTSLEKNIADSKGANFVKQLVKVINEGKEEIITGRRDITEKELNDLYKEVMDELVKKNITNEKLIQLVHDSFMELYDAFNKRNQPEEEEKKMEDDEEQPMVEDLNLQPLQYENEDERKDKQQDAKEDGEQQAEAIINNHLVSQKKIQKAEEDSKKTFLERINENPETKKIVDQLKLLGKTDIEIEQYVRAYLEKQLLPANVKPITQNEGQFLKQHLDYIYSPNNDLQNSNKSSKVDYKIVGGARLLQEDRMLDLYKDSLKTTKQKRRYTKTPARERAIQQMINGKKKISTQIKFKKAQEILQTIDPQYLPMMNQRKENNSIVNENIKNEKIIEPNKNFNINSAILANSTLYNGAGLRFFL